MKTVAITKQLKANVAGMRSQIDSNTVAIIASCPEFPFGNYDPLPEIGMLALRNKIGCHADCCLGGFINPFVEDAGFKLSYVPDFRIPGVTTISCDTHKYGYGPKGHSLCLFKNSQLRSYSFFAESKWHGGLYITPTMAGSRPGAIIAGTWTALM